MQRKVLNDLYNQGGITSFVFPGESEIPLGSFQKLALALNAGARFLVIDFTGMHPFKGDAPVRPQEFFESPLTQEFLDKLSSEEAGWTVCGTRCFPKDDSQFRNLYHNLQQIKKFVKQTIIILPQDITDEEAYYAKLSSRLIVIDCNSVEEASEFLEDLPHFNKANLLWLLPQRPNKKKFYHAYRAVRRSNSFYKEIRRARDWKKDPDTFAKIIENLQKIAILNKNPLDGISKLFRNFFPLLFIFAIVLPFLFSTGTESVISNIRNRIHERDKLSVAPSFEFTFDGKETMQRIARYAIGRFSAIITNEQMVRKYVNVTLEENGYPKNAWEKNKLNYPPDGTIIKFSRPDYIKNTATDSIGAAWKYWTSIVSDSVAYITEFYHAQATANFRQHNGIDVASRQGARILAPFAAKAWTTRDERGGIVIGLVRKKDVVLFMHCDQLLYLDGQEVMAGDPIATVGLTGHTTGPHAHIVTGLIDKNGPKVIGNVRYKVIDPIKWFYIFKPTADAVRSR